MDSNSSLDEMIKTAAESMVKHAPELDKKNVESMFRDYFEKGIPFYKSMGINDDYMKFLYASAYQSYMSGLYEKALAGFIMLNTYDMAEPQYILGKALCYKDMKKYPLAIAEFLLYASHHPEDPEVYWNMYECFTEMDEQTGAAASLGAILYICDKNHIESDLKNKAEMALVKLSDEMSVEESLEKQ